MKQNGERSDLVPRNSVNRLIRTRLHLSEWNSQSVAGCLYSPRPGRCAPRSAFRRPTTSMLPLHFQVESTNEKCEMIYGKSALFPCLGPSTRRRFASDHLLFNNTCRLS